MLTSLFIRTKSASFLDTFFSIISKSLSNSSFLACSSNIEAARKVLSVVVVARSFLINESSVDFCWNAFSVSVFLISLSDISSINFANLISASEIEFLIWVRFSFLIISFLSAASFSIRRLFQFFSTKLNSSSFIFRLSEANLRSFFTFSKLASVSAFS